MPLILHKPAFYCAALTVVIAGLGWVVATALTPKTAEALRVERGQEQRKSAELRTKMCQVASGRYEASSMAERAVAQRFTASRSPAFSGMAETSFSMGAHCTWTVRGWVAAPNSVGAKLRTPYRVVLRFGDLNLKTGTSWQTRSVDIY